uniref:Phosphonate ABC transporter permease protein phnE1 (TC 3.A.1.9.1) n=1 Tax=uncultured bacterium contig00060 TaxID=1181543 RepID=A0A806K0I0_9BACT|nr:phosphonate ABC transporter permease protein phnE1 (TC 3.A.1.9.1) [uncultured bacterium contig00060]
MNYDLLMPKTNLQPDGVIVIENPWVEEKQQKIPVGDFKRDLPIYLFLGIFFALSAASLMILQLDWGKVVERLPRLGSVLLQMIQFSTERLSMTMLTLTETITVSLLALIYGMVFGLVLGALAARNITPWQPLSVFLKSFFAFIRAVPTPVWVLLVLASMGFGMASGIMGLGFHVMAFFGRVFAQVFEEVPEETIEALRATGANRVQVFFGAILPSSLSGIIAWTALRFETNYGEASILGMVGAGGVGYTILVAMSSHKLGRAGLAVLIVFIFALGIELLTTYIKRKVKV